MKRVEIAGSFRRMKETVGDLDMLAVAAKSSPVMERFARYEEVKEVLSSGPTRSTVILKNGIQVDLRVLPQESYGAALQYFTGSKAHNILIRRMAQDQGLKINEYGVFRDEKRIAGETEESVYAAVGLPWIPPELREDRGEIEAARAGTLPRLVELADLKGDLHAHSQASDGHDTIAEMAQAAEAHGLDYIAITDPVKHLTVAHGLDTVRLRKHIARDQEAECRARWHHSAGRDRGGHSRGRQSGSARRRAGRARRRGRRRPQPVRSAASHSRRRASSRRSTTRMCTSSRIRAGA